MKIMKLVVATIITIVTAMIITILSSSVYAGTVSSALATENEGKITVSGSVDSSVYAVAILVYSGDNLEYMETANVNSSGAYNVTLEKTFEDGTYTIKVADYNGGDYAVKEDLVVGEGESNEIKSINVTLEAPVIGETVTTTEVNDGNMGYFEQDKAPKATAEDGANYKVDETMWIKGTYLEVGDDFAEPISTTFEKDKDYYAIIYVSAKDGYKFASGLTIKVNGEEPAEVFGLFNDGGNTYFIAKIKATEKSEEAEETNSETTDTEVSENTEKSPQTGDTIRAIAIVLAVAVATLGATFIIRKKNISSKH